MSACYGRCGGGLHRKWRRAEERRGRGVNWAARDRAYEEIWRFRMTTLHRGGCHKTTGWSPLRRKWLITISERVEKERIRDASDSDENSVGCR